MADQNTTDERNEDGSLNPHYVEPGSESADDTKKKVVTDDDGADDEGDKGDEGFDDNIDANKPPEIPIRNSNLQHILARKNEKIKKLESRIDDDGYDAPSDDGDDSNLTPEADKAIETKLQNALKPLLGKMASDADEAEFQALIKDEPEAAKYANHIKAYMAHEAYKGVPPVFIYRSLAFDSAKAMGAKKRAVADKEANLNKGGGRGVVEKGSIDGLPTAQDIANMSEKDFEEMENRVRNGQYS